MIPSDKNLENYNKSIKKRLLLVTFLIAIIFVFLGVYLYTIVIFRGEEYNKIVLSQRQVSYNSQIIEAKRGDIYDVNKKLLATSVKTYNLIIDPKIILSDKKNYFEATCNALSEVYGYDKYEMMSLIENRPNSSYLKYKKNLSYEERNSFIDFSNKKNEEYRNKKQSLRIRGIWFEDEYVRKYPHNNSLSNVIGYLYNDNSDGVFGIEKYYNEELSGVDGRRYGYLDDEYNLLTSVKNEIDGYNLITTVDLDIQQIVEKYIDKWEKEDIGSKEASVIVMNPNNGEILAMASNNSFDLNNPRDLSMYSEEDLYKLGIAEALERYNKNNEIKLTLENMDGNILHEEAITIGRELAYYKNWKNNCIQNTFEPGSTSKIFTVAAGLDENIVNEETKFLCEGNIKLTDGENNWTIRCNNRNGHGNLSLEDALIVSCNMSMAEIGEMIGVDIFTKYQEIFGFGQKTNIDLPYEADTSNLIYSRENMGRTALATNSFGQNFNCTMIQMISAYASIINGGTYYEPHIVKRIEDRKGTIVREIEKKTIRKTASMRTVKFIKDALFKTVEIGTGKLAKVSGVSVGGKTGTAEKLPRSNKNYLVSFCGFASVEHPEYLIYVVIDEPKLPGEAQAKAAFATKLFSDILKDIEKIKKEEGNKNTNLDELDEGLIEAVIGSSIDISLNSKKPENIYKGTVNDEVIVDNANNDGFSAPNLLPGG